MKIRNNIYAWLYFSPIILSIIWGIIDKSSAGIPFAMIFFLPFALISFIDIKFFKFIRRLVFYFFVLFAWLYSIPRFWPIDEEHTFIKLALLFIFIVFIQSIAEYQWHKKFKQHYKKYILIFSLVILYLSHSVYQYMENKKTDNMAKYICQQADNYKKYDELQKHIKTKFNKEPSSGGYYMFMRPYGFFDTAAISCFIGIDEQGNIISKEIKY